MAENTKENTNSHRDNNVSASIVNALLKYYAELNIAEEDEASLEVEKRIEILAAAEKLRETINSNFKINDEMQLTVILDERTNWEAGVELFTKTIGPYVTHLMFEASLDEYIGYHEQFKGSLKNFSKLVDLGVNNLDDAIWLDFPNTVKQLSIKRFNCYTSPEQYKVLQKWRKNRMVLLTKSASYKLNTEIKKPVVFPKLNTEVQQFLEKLTSKKLALKEQNLFDFNEVKFNDIDCFLAYFTPRDYSTISKKLEKLKNLKTIRLLCYTKGCFFIHYQLKLGHIQEIELYTNQKTSEVNNCLECAKSLKKSCPNLETLQIRGDFLNLSSLVDIAPTSLKRLKLKYFHRPVDIKFNFPQLQELSIGGGQKRLMDTDEWLKSCVYWPQMKEFKILKIGHKMYIDKAVLLYLARQFPNLEEFMVIENEFFTDDLKLLAEELFPFAKVYSKTRPIIF